MGRPAPLDHAVQVAEVGLRDAAQPPAKLLHGSGECRGVGRRADRDTAYKSRPAALQPFLSAGGGALLRAPRREVLCRRAVHHALLSVEDNQQGDKDISQGVD